MKYSTENKKFRGQKGFSIPELIIVLLIIAILAVLALPQLISSRRLMRFSGIQRQMVSTLVETRQAAMAQRKPITFQYDDAAKRINVFGGNYGALGDTRNVVVELTGSGLEASELIYGRPASASVAALADTSNMTNLSSDIVKITFQADGSVIDATNAPQNNALFFHNANYPDEMAFGVSILGAGGRVKVWHYNSNIQQYVE